MRSWDFGGFWPVLRLVLGELAGTTNAISQLFSSSRVRSVSRPPHRIMAITASVPHGVDPLFNIMIRRHVRLETTAHTRPVEALFR